MKKLGATSLVVLALLVVAPTAFAGGGSSSSILNGYGKVAAVTAKVTKPKATKPIPTTKPGTTLPFTGLDLGIVGGFAVLLIGLGVGMRRLGRS
jgi:hypothetical protein